MGLHIALRRLDARHLKRYTVTIKEREIVGAFTLLCCARRWVDIHYIRPIALQLWPRYHDINLIVANVLYVAYQKVCDQEFQVSNDFHVETSYEEYRTRKLQCYVVKVVNKSDCSFLVSDEEFSIV